MKKMGVIVNYRKFILLLLICVMCTFGMGCNTSVTQDEKTYIKTSTEMYITEGKTVATTEAVIIEENLTEDEEQPFPLEDDVSYILRNNAFVRDDGIFEFQGRVWHYDSDWNEIEDYADAALSLAISESCIYTSYDERGEFEISQEEMKSLASCDNGLVMAITLKDGKIIKITFSS